MDSKELDPQEEGNLSLNWAGGGLSRMGDEWARKQTWNWSMVVGSIQAVPIREAHGWWDKDMDSVGADHIGQIELAKCVRWAGLKKNGWYVGEVGSNSQKLEKKSRNALYLKIP